MILGVKKYKLNKRESKGMSFMSEDLAQARVNELAMYGRKAKRKGKTVYELFD